MSHVGSIRKPLQTFSRAFARFVALAHSLSDFGFLIFAMPAICICADRGAFQNTFGTMDELFGGFNHGR